MGYENNSLDRAMLIVDAVLTSPGLRLKELSEKVAANQTTVLRTMRVLERHGMVRRDSRKHVYFLGTKLVELGSAAAKGIDAVASLRPLVQGLSDEFGVTAHVGLLYDGAVTVVDKVDPRELIVRYSLLGTRMPLHATAAGKAVLALVGVELMEEVGLHAPYTSYGPNSIVDRDRLVDDVLRTRQRGFSVEREEYHPGFACVGTALRINEDIYAISLSGPSSTDSSLEVRGNRLSDTINGYLRDHKGMATGIQAE